MKQQLRQAALTKRAALSADERAAKSQNISERIKELPAFQEAKTVMLYLDFRGEVETEALIEELLVQGKRVVVPVCNADKTITPKQICNISADLQAGTWGIREPKPEVCPSVDPLEIDLVLVPGVAFDANGNRVGYGAGYYDRFVPQLRAAVPLVALAFEAQILPEIQPDPHDCPMHMVVTESRLIMVK
ncbi:MAG: 5-formyltetrahydrofolate cyclo-ligase [Peptococcaceae bacterium]|nr:5-formyltetrahydrofolate cyclo-ligase [Peptococcaceae bacterium]